MAVKVIRGFESHRAAASAANRMVEPEWCSHRSATEWACRFSLAAERRVWGQRQSPNSHPGVRVPSTRARGRATTEHELRTALEQHRDGAVRDRELGALVALEAARDGVAEASSETLAAALAHLDAVLAEP
jgi:hypothetical protein